MFNSYFNSIFFQRIDYEPPGKCDVQVERTGVKEYLITLNKFKSLGLDEQPRILKELAEEPVGRYDNTFQIL